jgi:hypothetical protein
VDIEIKQQQRNIKVFGGHYYIKVKPDISAYTYLLNDGTLWTRNGMTDEYLFYYETKKAAELALIAAKIKGIIP